MFRSVTRSPRRLVAFLSLALLLGLAAAAHAAVVTYVATLNGANESPPNGSAGTGMAQVDVDATANTMRVVIVFTGLTGTTTASHIHAPTAVAGTGLAGVATTTPTFTGFPLGVTFGSYDHTYDMTQATSYNPSYITANGGTATSAETALFAAIAAGKAYVNIHTTAVPAGEIRGFLAVGTPTPTQPTTWGRIKAIFQ